MAASRLWVSQWEWNDLSGLYQWTLRASAKSESSLRHLPHVSDLQLAVPAMIPCLFTGLWLHQSMVQHDLSWQVSDRENGWDLSLCHDSRWLFVHYTMWHTGFVVTMTAWKTKLMRKLKYFCLRLIQTSCEVLMKSLGAFLWPQSKETSQLQITGQWTGAMSGHLWDSACADSKERHKQWRERSATCCASCPPCLQASEVVSIHRLPKALKSSQNSHFLTKSNQRSAMHLRYSKTMFAAKSMVCQITIKLLNINHPPS